MTNIQNIISDNIRNVEPHLTEESRDILKLIPKCKTGTLGYIISKCIECGSIEYHPLSCRNRNCPCCQNRAKELWIERQKMSTLNTKYYHLVATVPNVLYQIFMQNQEEMYELLMKTSADALMELCLDEKYVGGKIGILQILHTWNQKMMYHPHAHMLVPAIGLRGEEIVYPRNEKYLVPVYAYSKLYRGKFISRLNKKHKDLKFYGEMEKYKDKKEWNKLLGKLEKKEFVTYVKEPYENANTVIEYFGRYTYKIVISESRIISYDGKDVIFRYKDRKDNNKNKTLKISGEAFTERYALHILPKGFRKIRGYGILANKNKSKRIESINEALNKVEETIKKFGNLVISKIEDKEEVEEVEEVKSNQMYRCSKCKGELKLVQILTDPIKISKLPKEIIEERS